MTSRKILILLIISTIAITFLCFSILHFADTLPPAPPTSSKEAFTILESPRYSSLSSLQKDEYVEQTFKLLETSTDEERRELFTSHKAAVEELMTRRMDSLARKLARGEDIPQPTRDPSSPRPQRDFQPQTQDPQTQETRRINSVARMQQQVATGDPQSSALLSQMRQSLGRSR